MATAVPPTSTAPVPPQSLEAEESILGALMLMPYDSPIIDDIRATGLQPGDFYRESHAAIYKAALELQGEQIDPDAIALTDRLEQQGRLETIGGRPRIHELAALVPATANAPHYATLVHEHGLLRGLIRTGQEIARLGWERPGTASDLLEQARLLVDYTANGSGPTTAVQLVTLEQFTSVTDDQAEPLIGTPDETLLPADGMLLMYGDGGAGKTTLSIDALAHVASGTEWLGNPIPTSVRCALIENEGPRGPFRRRLRHKHQKWEGKSFRDNVHVLEEPWTKFTLTDPTYRRGLAKEIDRTKTQLVIVGPLASLGAKGTGTPDDVNEFSELINDLRTRADQPFAIWIVHHENKAGDVSGAWERLPDTLVHVTAQGNGRTRVAWRKVRWSSALHGTSTNLLWAENTGFAIELQAERDLPAEIVAYLQEHPRSTTNDVVDGIKAKRKTVLAILKENDAFTYEDGPRRSQLWSVRDPATQLDTDWFPTPGNQWEPVEQMGLGSTGSRPVPPFRDGVGEPVTTPPSRSGPEPVGTTGPDDWVTDEPDDYLADPSDTMHE